MGELSTPTPPLGIGDFRIPDGPLPTRLGISVLEATPERVVGTMPVEGNTQPFGLLHGGASAALAETLGSVGAMLHAAPDKVALGVDLNITHHRGVGSGDVTGVAIPVHLGGSAATYEITISDAQDRRVASARLTCVLRPAPAAPNGTAF
ncbi:hotdog fold thioesterase [Streptomyces sp. NPDC005820]|uniref:PaaI family thioesterase n=1 Tax=Streptomyces sp. NPDC005820 TaxID=3157069 RepID=UPI0033F039F2